MRARFLVKMWKSGSGRSLIRDGNAICMVMGTRGENCTPGFERSSSFREPIFSPLPRSDTPPNCLTVNCVSRPTGLKQIFPPFFQLGDSSERERLLTIVVCGEQFFVSFLFFFSPLFVTKQLRSRLNWIHSVGGEIGIETIRKQLVFLWFLWEEIKMESLETKYEGLSTKKREREKKKSIQKEFLGGEREGCRME